jgi:hypothetical protein
MQTSFTVADALGLVQDFWSPIFEKELREQTLWVSTLLDPNYTMESIRGGDTMKISRIDKPTSTIRTIGTDADTFATNVLSTTQLSLQVNKRCVSAFEFEDLGVLMSQLEQADSDIRAALLADVQIQANDWVKSLIDPSSSSPDHVVSSVTDFNASEFAAVRLLAAQAKWRSSGEPWYIFADPSYVSDMIKDTTLNSADVMNDGLVSPAIEGRFISKRFGFNIVEDDSLTTDLAYAFIPSFMKVIAGAPRFKISDLHANKQFGYVISCDFPLGAVQMDHHRVIKIYNS